MQRNGTRRSIERTRYGETRRVDYEPALTTEIASEHRAIGIESRLEGGDGKKGTAEAGAHVAVTLEAHDKHTSPGSSGLKIPSSASIRLGRCCCGQRNGPNR